MLKDYIDKIMKFTENVLTRFQAIDIKVDKAANRNREGIDTLMKEVSRFKVE